MSLINKKQFLILFVGDILALIFSLWMTLLLRNFSLPDESKFIDHLIAFSFLFLVWIFVYYIAGLYEKHTLFFKSSLPKVLIHSQIINGVIAIVFFYYIPYFGITPKTILFIDLVTSLLVISIWRLYIFSFIVPQKKRPAILISNSKDAEELFYEVNNNSHYDFKFIEKVDDGQKSHSAELIKNNGIEIVVMDLRNSAERDILPKFYDLIFDKVMFIDINDLYEAIFGKIPPNTIRHDWFLENISSQNHVAYDVTKRLMDTMIAFLLLLPSLLLCPFIILAIWLEDRHNPFIVQNRVGETNRPIKIFKFRSMTRSDDGKWIPESDNKITRVGKIIRNTRLDELPQLWNVIRGDLPLIGPRPDINGLFDGIRNSLPYYAVRNIVKPGLSGWAQINQEIAPQNMDETRTRLSYDLYYVKNRSLFLGFKIALQTIKTLVSRSGR